MNLTNEQTIRLEVFRHMVRNDTSTEKLIEDIKKVSAVIYGEEWPAVVSAAPLPVIGERTWGADGRNSDGSVTYRGVTFEVPGWACHVAADFDGEIYAYEEHPKESLSGRVYFNNGGESEALMPRLPSLDGSNATYPVLDIRT